MRTVDVLPTLPQELDIVLLRPPDQHANEPRYQRQFQRDFRIRRHHVLAWLRFLRANHLDYRHVTISTDRLAALPADGDVSLAVPFITDDTLDLAGPAEPPGDPLTTQSAVISLAQDAMEAHLILEQFTGHRPPAAGVPAPSIRYTPIDESSGQQRIFAQAFPTLYPTGRADINTP